MNLLNAILVKFGDGTKDSCLVHEDIICSQSGYFQLAYWSNMPDTPTRTIDISSIGITPGQFDAYLEWLYTRKATFLNVAANSIGIDQPVKGCTDADNVKHRMFHVLVGLWHVGTRLQDPDFQDEIIRAIFCMPSEVRMSGTKCRVLRGIMLKTADQESTLRRVCLDLMECRLPGDGVDDLELKDWTKEYSQAIMKRLAARSIRGETQVPAPTVGMYVEQATAAVVDLST